MVLEKIALQFCCVHHSDAAYPIRPIRHKRGVSRQRPALGPRGPEGARGASAIPSILQRNPADSSSPVATIRACTLESRQFPLSISVSRHLSIIQSFFSKQPSPFPFRLQHLIPLRAPSYLQCPHPDWLSDNNLQVRPQRSNTS